MSEFKIKVDVDLNVDDVESQLKKLGKDNKISIDFDNLDLGKIETQLNRIKNTFKNTFKFDKGFIKDINKLTNALDKLSRSGANTNLVNNTVSQYKDLANTVTKLQKQLNKGGLGEESIKRTKEQINKLKADMESLFNKMSSSQKKSLELFDIKNENKELVEFNDKLNKIETTATSLQTKLKGLSLDHINTDVVSRLENELKEIKDLTNNMDISFNSESLGDLLTILSRVQSEIKNLEKIENLASTFDKISGSANEVGIEIRGVGDTIDKLVSDAGNLDGTFDRAFADAKEGANELKSEIKEVQSAMEQAENSAKNFGSSFLGTWKDFTGNFSQFTMAEVAGDFVSDGIRTAIGGIKDTVVDTDSAIRDLKKVYGSLEGDELESYMLSVTTVAKNTGQTSIDIINATAKAVQSGIKDLDQALQYAEKAAIFANVGDVDQSQADTMIASIMSAYAGGVENSLNYVQDEVYDTADAYDYLTKFIDLANYAGNNFAISTADVGQALQISGAALSANGVSMEESIAMIVGMNEVLQDAGKTGNALKSISVSMAGITTSAKDGTLQSNKAAKALKELAGIDVWDKQTGEIKDTYEIMSELYEVWDDLSEAEQAGLAASIAGKQNINAFQALMTNWEKVIALKDAYYSGETRGSAEAENAEYLDSIIAKWNAIKENLKSVVNSLISSEAVKGFLDILEQITAKLAEFAATDLGKNAFGLGAIATTIGVIGTAISKIPSISKIISGISGLGKIAGLGKTAASLGKIGTAAKTLGTSGGALQAISSALSGIGATAAGIAAAAVAVVGLATAIGDCTSLMSTLQDGEGILGFFGSMIASGSEMMNGIVQTTLGTGWEFGKLIFKELGAILTGNFSEIDDIWREGTANINTNLNEGLTDFTDTTTTSLKLMKESTQEELSEVYDIYNNEFKRLPNLTADNMDEMADVWTDKLYGMTDESILIAQGMGGEIGATLFKGIEEGMSKEEIREIVTRNLQTLLSSGIITQDMVDGLVNEFNTQFDKAIDSNANYKQTTTDVFNQITDGIKTGDIKDGFKDASKIIVDWSNEMIATYAQQGEAHKALMEGITADMTDKEIYETMYKNAEEYRKKEKLSWEELNQQIREEQQEFHAGMVDDAEEAKEKTAEQYAGAFEDLDYEQRVKLATEFEHADEAQLARIHEMLNRFEEPVQVKLKSEGYKEVLEESENISEFLENLPEDKLIEIMSDVNFVGQLSPEELQIAVDRLPDEKLSQLLVQTKFLNELTPEQLEIMLMGLPEEKRIEIITQYVHSGKRTPEQLSAALQTLPPEKVVQILTEYINEGATPEQIEKVLQALPPEVRTVVRAALEDAGLIEKRKKEVEEIPEEKTTHLTTETDDDGLVTTKEGLDELPEEKTTTIKVEKEDGEPEKTKEELDTLDNKEVNPKINPLSDNSGMYMTDEQLNIMDNKEVNPEVKTKSDDKEIDETNKKLDETDGKTATANVEVKVNGPTTSSGDEGMYTDKDALLKVVGLSETQTVTQTVEVKAEVTGVDTSGVSQVEIEPIKMKAIVEEVDITNIKNIKVEPIKITADSSNAMLKVNNVTQGLAGIKDKTVKILADGSNATLKISNITQGLNAITDKTVKILADSSNATSKITSVTQGLNAISDKTVKILGDSSNATLKISNVTQGLASIPDKTVKILADSSNAMTKINNVKTGLNSIKDKTITIKANASQAISTINSVKSALSGVRNKTVSVSVNKTVTERTVSQSSNARQSTPMLTNSSLASVPVSASVSPLSNTPVTISENSSLASVPVSSKASSYGSLDVSKILPSLDLGISHIKDLEEALGRLGGQLDFINEKAEATFGQEKVDLLQQQIPLLREQQKIQEQIAKNERSQNNELINWLSNKGFTFDNLGNIDNYNDKLLEMEENVKALKEKYEALNNTSVGNKNEKAIESANRAYESANDTLSKTKKYLEEYFATNNQELLEASQKWWEYENSIRNVEKAIRDLSNEQLQNNINLLSDEIAFLDAKMGAYTGVEKLNIINQQNELYRQQQQALHVLAEQLRSQLALMGQGTQEAIELQREINKLSTEWWNLESAIVGNNNTINDYYESQREEEERARKEAEEEAERAREEAERAAEEAKRVEQERRLNPLRDGLEEIRYVLDEVNDRLEILNSLSERSQGKTKVNYLNKEIDLLNEKLKVYGEEVNKINNLANGLMVDLNKYGFVLDTDGSIFNYDEILNIFAGTEEYDEVKKLADEYMNLMRDDYANNKQSIIDIQNEIKNLQDEIEKAERELALFSSKNRLTKLNQEFDELSTKLDIIDSKLEYAFGTDKITLMKREIELLNDQLELQSKKIDSMHEQAQVYTNSLSKYGFKFNQDGGISNYEEIMETFRDNEQVENIKELCEEYIDLQGEIDNLSSEYNKLEKSVKDVYSEMLDTTEDIEKEITELIEKEYEKRKEEIEKYTDERITLLEKERKQMEELWDEQDYTKSVKEQSDEIMELQKRISILSKDTSIEGQKKLKELAEELTEAQEKLEELTEDKIRNDYSDNVDGEIEKLENEEKEILESLDEKFSEVNIAKMVQEALTSGFIEINGEMQSIQDVLIESINESAEGYSVMAEVIKNQLVSNLNVAVSTSRELLDIYKELDLMELGSIPSFNNAPVSIPNYTGGSKTVSVGDINLTISGNVSDATVEQIEDMIKQARDEMLDEITKNL